MTPEVISQHAGNGVPTLKSTVKTVMINPIYCEKFRELSPVPGFNSIRKLTKYLLENGVLHNAFTPSNNRGSPQSRGLQRH